MLEIPYEGQENERKIPYKFRFEEVNELADNESSRVGMNLYQGKKFACKLYKNKDKLTKELETNFKMMDHPNVQKLIEITQGNKETDRIIVSEYAGSKTIKKMIESEYREKKIMFPLESFFKLATGMTKAVQYLHNDLGMIHRQLHMGKWVTQNDKAVLLFSCDSKVIGKDGVIKALDGPDSKKYHAPEVREKKSYGIKSDVWTLGKVFNRMLQRGKEDNDITMYDPDVVEFIEWLKTEDVQARPTIDEVAERLQLLIQDHEKKAGEKFTPSTKSLFTQEANH